MVTHLPVCASRAATWPLALQAGAIALTLQVVLGQLLARRPSGVLRDTADYTAHSIVALGLMILLSSVGVRGWWYGTVSPVGVDRLLAGSPEGRWMAAVVLGCFVGWDIPTSLQVKALRKPDVVVHHAVMAVLAGLGCTVLPMHYIFYYFGVVELSSIPLILYDQVTHWKDTLANQTKTTTEKDTITQGPLESIQSVLGVVAALAFTTVRVVSFTQVTLLHFLPDCRSALATAVLSSAQRWTIRFLMVACGGFTMLQWYWFSQMIKAFQNDAV